MTKKIARPSAGRTSGGPTIVTSVPPARTSGAERSKTSPPNYIEHHVDLANLLQPVGLQVHERVRA